MTTTVVQRTCPSCQGDGYIELSINDSGIGQTVECGRCHGRMFIEIERNTGEKHSGPDVQVRSGSVD